MSPHAKRFEGPLSLAGFKYQPAKLDANGLPKGGAVLELVAESIGDPGKLVSLLGAKGRATMKVYLEPAGLECWEGFATIPSLKLTAPKEDEDDPVATIPIRVESKDPAELLALMRLRVAMFGENLHQVVARLVAHQMTIEDALDDDEKG